MEHRRNFIPNSVDVLRFYGRLGMEINKPTIDLPNHTLVNGHAPNMANKTLLGNSAQIKQKISPDTSISPDNTMVPDTNSRNVHIPYILNGELFEIQTQDGENVTVKCCNCPPDRVYRGSVRSTGNFHMHIKRRHPDLMGKIYDMKVNALVERRDRFLRNRKSTRRRNTNGSGNRGSSSRNEQRLTCSVQPSSELFKIKAAFQRHQLQQQEQNRIQQDQTQQSTEKNQGILQKWNVIDHFLVTPAFERTRDIMEAFNEQPLNYSLKQNTVANMNCSESTQDFEANDANTSDNLNTTNLSETIDTIEQITDYEVMSTYNKASDHATETKRKICAVYGNDAVSERVVQIWFSKFRKGDTSCVDGQRTGRPGVADSDKVKMLIERNPHFTTKKIAEIISLSEKTVADYLQRLGYVADGDGWRFDDSAPKSNDNNSNKSLMDGEISVAEAEVFGYCNEEFAYEPSLNCNVQIAPTEENSPIPRPPSVSYVDFTYIENDNYNDMKITGKENDDIGNTGSTTLPSFSEYFSNVYTSYLRGGDGYCAIENININSVDTFSGGYPLKSYE
ncbi:uncharacterized protein LOC105221294 isoform X2 [Zeugodacus cucurbitae]|uniref:uncharacterized protein LOC105221294 isoform X2 n=1 Tax=Zeugodacus cucurbitae TaxID=28588 RepID=UPI0023D94711|nr:uncharacterized protein LOC105221294 isoform X2 [Zeugodacus cucurbitae]